MKRILLVIALLSTFSLSFAQNVKNEVSYLKITNNLWYTSILYKSIMEKPTVKTKEEALPQIKRLVKCSKIEYLKLENIYPNDTVTKKVKQWIDMEESVIKKFDTGEWAEDPTWQLMFYLVQLDIEDFIKEDLCE